MKTETRAKSSNTKFLQRTNSIQRLYFISKVEVIVHWKSTARNKLKKVVKKNVYNIKQNTKNKETKNVIFKKGTRDTYKRKNLWYNK